MVAIKHGVALVLLLAVLGLSTAFAASPKRKVDGLVTEEEVKKVLDVQHPYQSARALAKAVERIVDDGKDLADKRKVGKTKSAAQVAEYKKHSSKHSGYDKDHKDSYKHKGDYHSKGDYYPKGDYYSKGEYPSGYGGDYNPGYGYGPPAPVTPEETFDLELRFYYSGDTSDTELNATLAYGKYEVYWEAYEPAAGDPYYGEWYTSLRREVLLIPEHLRVVEGTAGNPTKMIIEGYYTDHSTSVFNWWANDFRVREGETEYEAYGTPPNAFSLKHWHLDGSILLETTEFRYLGPEGYPRLCGVVTEVSSSPIEETNALHAMDPIWRKHFEMVVDFSNGC